MNDILLITISGEDQRGLTATITSILAEHEVNVLDIGQAVIHDTLSLGVLVEVPSQDHRAQVVSAVQTFVAGCGLAIRCIDITPESYRHWVEAQGRARYIITLLARKITADQLAQVTGVVSRHQLNIDSINRSNSARRTTGFEQGLR